MLLTLGKDDLSDRKHTLAWKGLPYQAMKSISNIKKKDSLKVLKTVLYIRRMDLVNNPYKKIECDK